MMEALLAVLALAAGCAAGWLLGRRPLHIGLQMLIVVLSAAVVFCLAGWLGGSRALDVLDAHLHALWGNVETDPSSALVAAPVSLTFAPLAPLWVMVEGIAWAMTGALLWLVGMGLGLILTTSRRSVPL